MFEFYQTPLGKKFIAKPPELTTETMKKMQNLMRTMMPEIQREVAKAVGKQ